MRTEQEETRDGESARPVNPVTSLTLQSDKSNVLTLTSTGTGDLADLASNLQPQRASFAYAKVKYNNDEHSFREKFILVIWIGDEVKVMRRAKVCLSGREMEKACQVGHRGVSSASRL